MAKDYSALAKTILQLVGGEANVAHLEHCSTRLRFSIVDGGKVDKDALKATSGVMGVIANGNQCQVVIGGDVIEVFNELKKIGTFNGGGGTVAPSGEKKNFAAATLDFLVGVFQPLVPAIAGGGILKAFLSLFALLGWIDKTGVLYRILIAVADAPLYYLPLMVAVTMSVKINCNKLVALASVGALLLPDVGALLGEEGVNLLGISIQNVKYAYQVFPAILAVASLYFIEKYVTKYTPKPIRVFFVPMICFIIVFPATLLFLGPVGLSMGKIITAIMLWIYSKAGWLAVGLVAMLLPLLISIGAHKAFIPYVISSLGDLGYEILYNGASLAHNISEGGASLAVAVKTKDHELRSAAISGGISALFGITEPAIYSITLQHKQVLYGVMTGSFISGSFIGFMAVKAFVAMGPGLAGMAMFVDPENAKNIVWAFVGFGISLASSFIATLFFYKDEAVVESAPPVVTDSGKKLVSPMDGKLIDLSEVQDKVFSEGTLGNGMAIIPDTGELYAPADGTIDTVFDSKHAISIICDNGAEILLHIGLDTVKLEGKYFDVRVKNGDKVKAGQLLSKFDKNAIQKAGYPLTTPIIVTNSDDLSITKASVGMVSKGSTIMTF